MLNYLDTVNRRVYLALLTNFTLFGITFTTIGATIPQIIRSYNWSYTITGLVLSAGAIGYFSSTFLSGFLVRALGSKEMLLTGLFIDGVSFFFFAYYPSPLINTLLHFSIGLGQGTTEVVTNYSVISMEKHGQSRLMNLMHASFCIGAILGPFAAGNLLRSSLNWMMIYRFIGVIIFLMAAVFLATPFKGTRRKRSSEQEKGSRTLFQPMLVLFFLVLLLYGGSEVSVSNWISEYFVKVLNAPLMIGAFTVSILWIGILTGRLLISIIYRGSHQSLLLFLLASCSSLFLFLIILLRDVKITSAFAFFTGLGYSGIYPVVMTLVGKYFKGSEAVGFASAGGGIGAFTFPFFLAFIADRIGLNFLFIFSALINLVLLGLSTLILLKEKKFKEYPYIW